MLHVYDKVVHNNLKVSATVRDNASNTKKAIPVANMYVETIDINTDGT